MILPPVVALKDKDGTVHYMSSTCTRAVDGLADGSLTLADEVTDAADAAHSDSPDADKPRPRRGNGKPAARDDGDDDDPGVAGPARG